MCGRFERHRDVHKLTELIAGLRPHKHADNKPSYNIAPSQNILVARHVNDTEREWASLQWGLVPFWAKDLRVNKPINARAESVHEKPYFREAFKRRRCLVACDGWYEWQKLPAGTKQPYYITLKQDYPFTLAGLWERWISKDGSPPLETCCILTTEANAATKTIHDRMPLIIHPKDYELWLDPAVQSRDQLERALAPYHWVEHIQTWLVSRYVNKPDNNDERCLQRVHADGSYTPRAR